MEGHTLRKDCDNRFDTIEESITEVSTIIRSKVDIWIFSAVVSIIIGAISVLFTNIYQLKGDKVDNSSFEKYQSQTKDTIDKNQSDTKSQITRLENKIDEINSATSRIEWLLEQKYTKK